MTLSILIIINRKQFYLLFIFSDKIIYLYSRLQSFSSIDDKSAINSDCIFTQYIWINLSKHRIECRSIFQIYTTCTIWQFWTQYLILKSTYAKTIYLSEKKALYSLVRKIKKIDNLCLFNFRLNKTSYRDFSILNLSKQYL